MAGTFNENVGIPSPQNLMMMAVQALQGGAMVLDCSAIKLEAESLAAGAPELAIRVEVRLEEKTMDKLDRLVLALENIADASMGFVSQ